MVEDSPTSIIDETIATGDDTGAGGGGGAVDLDVEEVEMQLTQSALRDNISKKGKNAYYYAHAHKATGPEWDGKIEPRLLSTSSSNISTNSITSIPASSKAELMSKSNITNYAFLNEETKVKIYIDLPGVGDCCQDTDINLDYTDNSLSLTIKNYVNPSASVVVAGDDKNNGDDEMVVSDAENKVAVEDGNQGEDRCLSFAKLYGEIEKATFRKKADKVIVTLTKKEMKEWSSVIA